MQRILKGRNLWFVLNVLKASTLLFILYFLLKKLSGDQQALLDISPVVITQIFYALPFLIGLCALNWGLEAAKWYVLANSIEEVCYRDCLRGVICGLALSRVFPGGVGEFLGRLGYMNTNRRIETGTLVYFGGLVQFTITLAFGIYGLLYLVNGMEIIWYAGGVGIAILIISLLIFVTGTLPGIRTKFFFFASRASKALKTLSQKTIFQFFVISIVRYLVFGLQLYLLFDLMALGLDASVIMAGITLIFLSKTVLPTFNFLGDLGVREFSAVLFFGQFSIQANQVIVPTLVLWLINILLPSLLGLYFIAHIRTTAARAVQTN